MNAFQKYLMAGMALVYMGMFSRMNSGREFFQSPTPKVVYDADSLQREKSELTTKLYNSADGYRFKATPYIVSADSIDKGPYDFVLPPSSDTSLVRTLEAKMMLDSKSRSLDSVLNSPEYVSATSQIASNNKLNDRFQTIFRLLGWIGLASGFTIIVKARKYSRGMPDEREEL
jgi:hypothetical protein